MPRKRLKRVLLIEDDFYILDLYQRKLEEKNYKALIAQDGKVALDILEKEEVDLILLDISMPRMNGVDFMRELRKKDKYQDIPVIVLTNLAQDFLESGLRKLGVKDYLVKADHTPRQVVQKVREYIS